MKTGDWVDIKVEYSPERVRTFVDGKQIFNETMPTLRALHGVAGRMDDGTIILKLVNSGDKPQRIGVSLSGATGSYVAEGSLLTSHEPTDENTLEHPEKVAPKAVKLGLVRGSFSLDAPANSVMVVRLRKST